MELTQKVAELSKQGGFGEFRAHLRVIRDEKTYFITSGARRDVEGPMATQEYYLEVLPLDAPKIGYCTVHDTYPVDGDPCWQCIHAAVAEAERINQRFEKVIRAFREALDSSDLMRDDRD